MGAIFLAIFFDRWIILFVKFVHFGSVFGLEFCGFIGFHSHYTTMK